MKLKEIRKIIWIICGFIIICAGISAIIIRNIADNENVAKHNRNLAKYKCLLQNDVNILNNAFNTIAPFINEINGKIHRNINYRYINKVNAQKLLKTTTYNGYKYDFIIFEYNKFENLTISTKSIKSTKILNETEHIANKIIANNPSIQTKLKQNQIYNSIEEISNIIFFISISYLTNWNGEVLGLILVKIPISQMIQLNNFNISTDLQRSIEIRSNNTNSSFFIKKELNYSQSQQKDTSNKTKLVNESFNNYFNCSFISTTTIMNNENYIVKSNYFILFFIFYFAFIVIISFILLLLFNRYKLLIFQQNNLQKENIELNNLIKINEKKYTQQINKNTIKLNKIRNFGQNISANLDLLIINSSILTYQHKNDKLNENQQLLKQFKQKLLLFENELKKNEI